MNDAELARDILTIDPSRSTITLLIGGKGCGKSAAARTIFDGWPYDRVVIDPTGDARPDDPAALALIAPFPSQIPEPDPDADPPQTRVTVWARIDPASPTLEADQNDATNMALHPRHRPVMLWRDEFGLGVSANKMAGADRTLLMSSRHYYTSALLCCPRPRNIPKLALSQANRVLVWAVPDPDDREYVAKNFGVAVPTFEHVYRANRRRGKHAFLVLDREHDAILDCPPLPSVNTSGPKA